MIIADMYYHRLNARKVHQTNVIDLVKQTIRKYGKPLQILMTDHGSQFYNSHSKLQSDFDSFCKEHDIQHVMGSIGKPTTLGKD